MGHGLGKRLLAAGHELAVLGHRNRGPIDDLASTGACEVASPADLAGKAEIVILCLPNSSVVNAVLEACRASLNAGGLVIDTGTSLPAESRRWAGILKDQGVDFADCPLTGGPEQAAVGELGALCGARADVFARMEPVIMAFASTIRHMGPVGSGHTAKLISNYLVTGMIALVGESFAAAAAAGIDRAKLYEAMLNGSGNSGVLRKMVGPALAGDYAGYRFAMANAAKDIGYYHQVASELGLSSPLEAAVHAFFLGQAKENGSRNVSELLREC
jgi:3-hydroxyisobutyrate dehydrogenase-like beta-hydroxyacid dehydrogenase